MPLTVGVIDQFSVPPLDSLLHSQVSPVVLANPYSGSGSLATFSGGVSAFGLRWSVFSAPAEAGSSQRSVLIYEEPFLSFSLHYVLADASNYVGDTVLTQAERGLYLFSIARPSTLDYHILPGWEVLFSWLIQP